MTSTINENDMDEIARLIEERDQLRAELNKLRKELNERNS